MPIVPQAGYLKAGHQDPLREAYDALKLPYLFPLPYRDERSTRGHQ